MSIIKGYYYLFYKYYNMFEYFNGTRWLSDLKAGIIVGILEVSILFSLINYWDALFGRSGELRFLSYKILIPFIIIVLLKWFAFVKDDSWKEYIKEFNQWPREKNDKGTWIVVFFTLFCVANVALSFYLNPPPRR